MTPLVSILIPAYNAAPWLSATIESALAQTCQRKEIVLVDDGSTDGTLEIARRYASKDVLVLSQSNQGGAAARNAALAACQGDFIQWLDADDLLAPNKIADQVAEAEGTRSLVSGPWGHFMYRQRAARFEPTQLWEDHRSPIEWIVRKWRYNLHMQTATWLVSRELSTAVGPWNTKLLVDDDGEYFTRVLLASRGVRFVSGAKVFYRIVGTRRLSYIGRSQPKVEAQLESMRLQIAHVRAVDDGPAVRAAIMNYLQIWLPHFYPERPDLVHEMEQLARAIGGGLHPPRISRKYALVDRVFGRSTAKQAQLAYNQTKTSLLRAIDRGLYAVERMRTPVKVGRPQRV